MLNRKFKDVGFEPALAFLIITIFFVLASFYFFYKVGYSSYVYPIISFSLTGSLSEIKRNEFLKLCFKTNEWRKIRVIENIIVAIPFLAFLLYKQFFVESAVLLIASIALAFIHFKANYSFTIPTPFSRKPFEFIVGFRNTFYLFPLIYILAAIAVYINNFNLGVFSMLFLFAVVLNYYAKPEDDYYVWSYKLTPKQFLFNKMKTALLYSSLLSFPVVLILGVAFFDNILYVLLFLLAGYAFLIAVVTAKYTVYPNEISLTQGFLIVMSLFFPPLLIAVIPYFFGQSVNRLKHYLK